MVVAKDAAGRTVKVTQHRLFIDAVEEYADFRPTDLGVLPFSVTESEGPSKYSISVERYRKVSGEHCGRPVAPDDTVVPVVGTVIGMSFDRSLTIQAAVDGGVPLKFLLDTGGHNILKPAAVNKLGLHAEGKDVSAGPGGHYLEQQDVRVKSLRVGDALLHDQHFYVVDLPYGVTEQGLSGPVAGILGMELLERFAVEFDYGKQTLTLLPAGAPLPGQPQSLLFSQDIPLTDGAFDGHSGIFSLDTGNMGAVALQGPWMREQKLEKAFALGTTFTMLGAGGAGKAIALQHQAWR